METGLPTCWAAHSSPLEWLQFQRTSPVANETLDSPEHTGILKLSRRLKIWKDVQKDYDQEVDVLKTQEGCSVSLPHPALPNNLV